MSRNKLYWLFRNSSALLRFIQRTGMWV